MLTKMRMATPNATGMFLILITLILSACNDRIKTDLVAFKALDEGLMDANGILDRHTGSELMSLALESGDPTMGEKATIWYHKAQTIRNYSSDLINYIEGLKLSVKKEAGLKTADGRESFKEADKNAVMRVFQKQEMGAALFQRLIQYKNNVLTVDEAIRKKFADSIVVTTRGFEARGGQDFTRTFFDDIPTVAALAMLTKFESNVRIIENKSIEFCSGQVLVQ